ncbi:MAG: threonine/serine dehydratase [Actinomycetota bacterium]
MLQRPVPPIEVLHAFEPLTLDDIRAAQRLIEPYIIRTPSVPWPGEGIDDLLAPATRVSAKLELLQRTGSFKARGALVNVLSLTEDERSRGITAVSAGNHAIAAAWAAQRTGTSAKVCMIDTANQRRRDLTARYGAEVVMAGSAAEAFAMADRLVAEEGRVMIHPFEGRRTALGTATCGLEFMEQVPDLDAVVVPVGGGGLIAGISAAVKLMNPRCRVFGVEPQGADSMTRSFRAGSPQSIEKVATIADSLGAPFALPYGYESARRNTDGIVIVTDHELRAAMRLTFLDAKLAVEPAGASALAALIGPLRDELAGAHVGLVVCGSNIDAATYTRLLLPD